MQHGSFSLWVVCMSLLVSILQAVSQHRNTTRIVRTAKKFVIFHNICRVQNAVSIFMHAMHACGADMRGHSLSLLMQACILIQVLMQLMWVHLAIQE